MNNRLEQYVRDHRDAFDAEEPDDKVWEKIRRDMDPAKKKQAPVVRLHRAWWSVAAALLLLIGGTTEYLISHRNNSGPAVARNTVTPNTSPATSPAGNAAHPDTQAATPAGNAAGQDIPNPTPDTANPTQDGAQSLAGTGSKDNKAGRDADNGSSELDASINEEMYHYAKLVEIKHKELKTIEKDEPLLYRQFSSDVNKLDSVYRSLQVQLPKNPNREQLLEAMLQNLQLQMGLLNHQLDIIQQINHSKKTAYEKAYKTT